MIVNENKSINSALKTTPTMRFWSNSCTLVITVKKEEEKEVKKRSILKEAEMFILGKTAFGTESKGQCEIYQHAYLL